MSRIASLSLLASLLCGCASYRIWPGADERAGCELPRAAWVVEPPELRWRRGMSFGLFTPTREAIDQLRATLPPYLHHYLRHGKGYAAEPAGLESGLAGRLQHWAWAAAPGDALPGELLAELDRSDLAREQREGMLLLVQGSFHPRSDLWGWVAAATLFVLPVLTVGDDHHTRVDAYALPGGAHLWRTDHGHDSFGYLYRPVSVTWDLLHTLPPAGEPCDAAPEP